MNANLSSAAVFLAAALLAADAMAADAEPEKKKDARVNRGERGWDLPDCAAADAEGEVRASTGCSGVFGVRGSLTDVQGVPAGTGAGFMVSGEGEEFVRRGLFNAHGSHRLALGGGGAGFEGTLAGSLAGGVRIPVAERHGPVIRAGGVGYLRGNDAFYASLLEIPQVQVGYQYMQGITVYELAATSGVVLTGRERVGDATRRILTGLEVGAYAAAQIPWFRLGARIARLPTDDRIGSETTVMEGTLCGVASPFALCMDARIASTDAFVPGATAPASVSSVYGGLTFGLTRER